MARMEPRLPMLEVDISGKSSKSFPLSCQIKLTGKSPSVIKQATCKNWPECTGLSSK